MHGVVFAELKKWVDTEHGEAVWPKLLEAAGLPGHVYMPISEYPDAEAMALVGAASRLTGKSAGELLEGFGEFIAPDLIAMYRNLVRPEWRTLDVLEHTEGTIHSVVRVKNKGAQPPRLHVRRVSPTEAVITYNSERKMCALAVGITRGLAKHYGERIAIEHSKCMHKGARACEIAVTVAAGKAANA